MEQALAGPELRVGVPARAEPRADVAVGPKVDGRRARGIRTRDGIVIALMELIAAGDIAPTAQRIADRAGVSVRSVYQHFTDVEGLYADASARALDWIRSASVDLDPSWPLRRRIDEYSLSRSTTLETLSSFARAARLIEPTSAVIQASRSAMRRWGRDRIAQVFAPELAKVDGPAQATLLAALDTISSAEAWEHLRSSGHSARSARQVLRAGMSALLASAGEL